MLKQTGFPICKGTAFMNIDQAKQQARALVSALKDLGLVDLSSSQALEVLAKMNGHRNWQTAQAAGNQGAWNALQSCVYRSYPSADLLPLEPGDAFDDCGDPLFAALMNLAGAHPLSRVIASMTHWARAVDQLQEVAVSRVNEGEEAFEPSHLKLPTSLPEDFKRFLAAELREDVDTWDDASRRLESVRQQLYTVLSALHCVQAGSYQAVMTLTGEDLQYGLPVLVPAGVSQQDAYARADKVLRELRERQTTSQHEAFDYSPEEVMVRLAEAGLTPTPASYTGPQWD